MRQNQTSMTAMGIAIVRAIESERPEGQRICYDPYARRFVSGFLYHFVRFFDRLGYAERKGPGVMGFLVARERHIDEFLLARLREGAAQVVILGAGLDARAYRIEGMQERRVFEVDHPASQRSKTEQVQRIFGRLPEHVTYVDVDFNTQSLAERLFACGFDPAQRSVFIWQGVTQYLSPQAVDSTLAFIRQHSPSGSSVIFDYMYPTLLDGTQPHGEVEKMRRDYWMTGEAMVFGIPEGQVMGYLEGRGFVNVENATCHSLHALYFHGANAVRPVADGYAIASARVP
jgi:methyltransferase (TIGR00027 family)